MASTMQSYKYSIEATYIANGKETTIISESIHSLITKYDYRNKNMPILYLSIKVGTDMYDDMVKNKDNGYIVLSTYKLSNSYDMVPRKSVYIRRMFSYVLSPNIDYNKTLNNLSGNGYRVCTFGLYDIELINKNNININGIILDSDMLSIVHHCTKNENILIEPFDDSIKIPYCVLPPIPTVSKMLKYLDSVHCFYNSNYRFFRDFDIAYLLSNSGNSIKSSDEDFGTVIISIMDPTDYQTKKLSIDVDRGKKAYILYIDASFTNIQVDNISDKICNKIISIDTNGNVIETNVDIPETDNYSEKIKYARIFSDNDKIVNHLKGSSERTISISVNKTEIDTSLLTPNKEYIVQNYGSYKQYDGKYILTTKIDVMLRQGENFISNTLFTLEKVKMY